MTETVELATIWLVDLVGSTRLATAVGPVRADSLQEEYFALLRDAIDASGGRAFRNTGDGLFVAFSSASAAVSCAVLTQQLFERRYRSAEQALHVRVGLGTGESTVKDGDYFGMPSIEAARLCDKAPVDGILVSAATKLLAGRGEGARFESVGEMELKGIPEPMEAFAVVWEPLADESGLQVGAWPVPAALRSVPRAPYVGRVDERALMERSRAQARGGARQAVLLSGEPGIGKTRLASHAALRAHAEGFAVCWGACSEDLAAPYEPWIEVCSQLVEHASDDVLDGYVASRGGEIGRLARNLARRVPDAPAPQSSDPETERFLLVKAVGELLLAVARSQPLCVVLDDFHWAEGQSVALLKHVAGAVEQGALMVIVTYRDSDLTKDHPLTGVLADLRRSEGVERIRLSGLGPDEVAELVAAAAGHELDADGLALAGGLATETGGNPFFVGEILRNLIESGAITFDETARRWSVDEVAMSSLPESVREVVEHRIDRLGEHGREALRIAAVIGRSFDVELLAQLVDMSEARLLDRSRRRSARRCCASRPRRSDGSRSGTRLINHTPLPRASVDTLGRGFITGSPRRSSSCTASIPTSIWASWPCTGGWLRCRSTGQEQPANSRPAAASARQPRSQRGRKAVRRRARDAWFGRERRAVRGVDRARRGAAPDGCAGLPRDVAGGGGDRSGAERRRPRRSCCAREQSRLR